MSKSITTLGLVVAVLLGASGTAQADFNENFQSQTAASEYGTGDFDPLPAPPYFINEDADGVIQVIDANTAISGGDPDNNPLTGDEKALKLAANSGFNRFQISDADVSISTVQFDFWLNPGAGEGGDRLMEVFVNDPGISGGFDLWSLRIFEDGTFDTETLSGGWNPTGVNVPRNQWNDMIITSDGPAGIVHMYLNGTRVGTNHYVERGDSFNDLNMFAGDISGTGAGVFLDNISITEEFFPEPGTATLLMLGAVALAKRARRA
ncbi:MAG: hypothetical protein CMJ18_05035 [Phycisphaeraceae bacterium]|nr:hypothetical protein [Phycisphaeraceae bacterium]